MYAAKEIVSLKHQNDRARYQAVRHIAGGRKTPFSISAYGRKYLVEKVIDTMYKLSLMGGGKKVRTYVIIIPSWD